MSEYNLIISFNEGSAKAFRVVFDKFYTSLLYYAWKLLKDKVELKIQ